MDGLAAALSPHAKVSFDISDSVPYDRGQAVAPDLINITEFCAKQNLFIFASLFILKSIVC